MRKKRRLFPPQCKWWQKILAVALVPIVILIGIAARFENKEGK